MLTIVMLRFFMSSLPIYVMAAGILGLYLWRAERRSYWYYFPILLLTIGALDALGKLLPHGSVNNLYYSYLVIPFQFLFYLWFYYKENPKNRDLMLISLGFYFLSFVIEHFLYQDSPLHNFRSLTYLVSNIILLVFILSYFYRLSLSKDILSFSDQRMFWISLGLLIFWLGSLPYYGLHTYLSTNYFNVFLAYTWFVVALNYIMYSLFICAFIWGVKKN